MVTYDTKSNIGFDFDINIKVKDDKKMYNPKELKETLMQAFNNVIYC